MNIDFIHTYQRVVKYYSRVKTEKNQYILKLYHLPMCPEAVLEQQAEWGQKFREQGISTPQIYVCGENYGSFHIVDGMEVYVLLEEDAGNEIEVFTKAVFGEIAALLGKMHAASIRYGWKFRKGSLYREVESGNTDYLHLWQKTGTGFLEENLLRAFLEEYEEHLVRMKERWSSLPVGMVQGDLYRMNLLKKEGKLMVIDFDRSGDEVFVSDFMSTWFRLLFDPVVQERFRGVMNRQTLCQEFLRAYETERTFGEGEKAALKDQYFIFGAVYGTRRLTACATQGNWREAAEGFEKLVKMLREDRWIMEHI